MDSPLPRSVSYRRKRASPSFRRRPPRRQEAPRSPCFSTHPSWSISLGRQPLRSWRCRPPRRTASPTCSQLNGGAYSSRRSADNRTRAYVAIEAGSPGPGAAARAAACILPSCGRPTVRPGAPGAPRAGPRALRDGRDPRKRERREGRGRGRRRRGRPRPVHKSERRTGARAGLRRGPQEARAPSGQRDGSNGGAFSLKGGTKTVRPSTANDLSIFGWKSEFRPTREKQGKRTSDVFFVSGGSDGDANRVAVEFKQPSGNGKQTICHQFEEAAGQSTWLMIDARQLGDYWTEGRIEEEMRRRLRRGYSVKGREHKGEKWYYDRATIYLGNGEMKNYFK